MKKNVQANQRAYRINNRRQVAQETSKRWGNNCYNSPLDAC